MKSIHRKVIACVASIINGHTHSLCLYDHDSKEHTYFFHHPTEDGFELRNRDNKALYSVEKKPVKWIIKSLETKKFIDLEKFSDQFKGYDYESLSTSQLLTTTKASKYTILKQMTFTTLVWKNNYFK